METSAASYVASEDANYWRYEIAPKGVKCSLKTIGGIQITGIWSGAYGEAFVAWAPLIKADKEKEELLAKHGWTYTWDELIAAGIVENVVLPDPVPAKQAGDAVDFSQPPFLRRTQSAPFTVAVDPGAPEGDQTVIADKRRLTPVGQVSFLRYTRKQTRLEQFMAEKPSDHRGSLSPTEARIWATAWNTCIRVAQGYSVLNDPDAYRALGPISVVRANAPGVGSSLYEATVSIEDPDVASNLNSLALAGMAYIRVKE